MLRTNGISPTLDINNLSKERISIILRESLVGYQHKVDQTPTFLSKLIPKLK